MYDVGSREDPPAFPGMAHLLEHVAFKGTQKRSAREIFRRIDAIGGQLNAFTTKEKTVFEVRCAQRYVERAVELLWDLTTAPAFPSHEIEKEKQVILEELAMYEDDPVESIHDHFEEQVFSDYALAHPVIGDKKGLMEITSEEVVQFYRENFTPARSVILISGSMPAEKVYNLVESIWQEASDSLRMGLRAPAAPLPPSGPQILSKPIQQAHWILGGVAPSLYAFEYWPTQILLHFLAGPYMSSHLNLLLRERHALTYDVHSFYNAYVDTGCWGIYVGCDEASLPKVQSLTRRSLENLARKPLAASAFKDLMRHYMGRLLLDWESRYYRLLYMGRYFLDRGNIASLESILASIEKITPQDLQQAACLLWKENPHYEFAYLPQKVLS